MSQQEMHSRSIPIARRPSPFFSQPPGDNQCLPHGLGCRAIDNEDLDSGSFGKGHYEICAFS